MTGSAGDVAPEAPVRMRFAGDAFARRLGVQITGVARGHATLRLPGRTEHLNAGGVLNGGASASLALMAGAVAAWTDLDVGGAGHVGCVDLALQYLATATTEDVVADARIVRRGRDLAFLDVEATVPGGRPICRALVTYRASDYGGRAPRQRARHLGLPEPARLTPPPARRLFDGYVGTLGVTPLHEEPGRVRLGMPCAPTQLDERGCLHAGALASLVDIAAVAASWSLIGRRPGARGSTIGMQVSFPATTAEAVVADAHVQQRAEELLFSTVHVTTAGSGQLVAMGQVSYRLLEPWPDARRPADRRPP